MIKILHFADAHIDMVTNGRRDPVSGLPLRTLDFLKALDTIVETAISEKVDLVIFAGDAYKDRTPVPTFQREWGRRIMRLSDAGVQTLLLVGNHDLSPAVGRANALQEFETLQVPHVRVISRPEFLTPQDLGGLPLQVIGLPWVSRSNIAAVLARDDLSLGESLETLEGNMSELVRYWLENKTDPGLPVILAAHASVEGAVYGGERSVMLGSDLVLPGGLVRDPRLDYVALGHIHKAQNLNEGRHPPVVYPGSIERVDFGEAADEKGFVLACVSRGETTVERRRLNGRRFIDRFVRISSGDTFQTEVMAALPGVETLDGAMVRLVLEYPRAWEGMLDEAALRRHMESAFEFHLVRRPQMETRLRIPDGKAVSSLPALELLDMYWSTMNTPAEERAVLQELAAGLIAAEPAQNVEPGQE